MNGFKLFYRSRVESHAIAIKKWKLSAAVSNRKLLVGLVKELSFLSV